MAEVASAYVSLIPSLKGAQGTIAKELGGVGKSAGADASKGFKGSFMSGLRSLAGPMAGLLGVTAGIGFLKDANAEARESQKVGALTASAIKATGGAAKVSAKQVADLAGALSTKTGIDDEVIQSGQNMLLTFKNVRNEAGKGNDIFNQSTKTLIDMSSAMGTEPKQAAIQLGKALNDPVKGITALSRVGVTFSAQQKNQIKRMAETGRTMDAQKIILKELNSEFGGAAAAQATAGDKAAVAWGNLKEQLGTALLPAIDAVAGAFTTKIIPAISATIPKVQALVGFIKQHKTAALALVGTITALVVVTKAHAAVMAVQAAGGLLAYLKATKLVTTATKVWAAVQWVMNAALTANPIGLVIAAIALLVVGIIVAWKKSETFRKIVTGAFAGVKVAFGWLWAAAQKVFGWLKANWPLVLAILTGPIGLAVLFIKRNWDKIVGFFKAAPGRIKDALGNFGSLLVDKGKDLVGGLWEGIKGMGKWLADKVIGFVTDHIPGPVAKALGIASPSKVMADQAKWIPLGMVDGIESQAGKVERAMSRVSSRVQLGMPQPALAGAAPGVAGMGGTELRGRLVLEGSEAHIEGVTRRERTGASRRSASDGIRRP